MYIKPNSFINIINLQKLILLKGAMGLGSINTCISEFVSGCQQVCQTCGLQGKTARQRVQSKSWDDFGNDFEIQQLAKTTEKKENKCIVNVSEETLVCFYLLPRGQ